MFTIDRLYYFYSLYNYKYTYNIIHITYNFKGLRVYIKNITKKVQGTTRHDYYCSQIIFDIFKNVSKILLNINFLKKKNTF